MHNLIRYVLFEGNNKEEESRKLLKHEWLLTNALGGYSSLSVGGANTRKYHGLLVAALPAPLGRVIMLNGVRESIFLDGEEIPLSREEFQGEGVYWDKTPYLKQFCLVNGLPVWLYQKGDLIIEKSILALHMQNTVHVSYKLLQGPSSIRLKWRPLLNFRHHEASVKNEIPPYRFSILDKNRYEIAPSAFPPLRLFNFQHGKFIYEPTVIENVFYRVEHERGYDCIGNLLSPGYFELELQLNQSTTFIASTENWDTINALTPI